MFEKLTNFSHKRTPGEAVIFYIVYLIALMVVAGIAAVLLDAGGGYAGGMRVGALVAIAVVAGLSYMVVTKRGLTKNNLYIAIGVAAPLLAILGGGLLGLIPVAYLTTVVKK